MPGANSEHTHVVSHDMMTQDLMPCHMAVIRTRRPPFPSTPPQPGGLGCGRPMVGRRLLTSLRVSVKGMFVLF